MSIAVEKLQAAQQHAMTMRPKTGGFPVLAAVLHGAGVLRNEWTLPSCQSLYVGTFGAVVQQGTPLVAGYEDVPSFDEAALVRALRRDQAGEGTFPEFLDAAWRAGVTRYVVDFAAHEVAYYGVDGSNYVERYPEVEVG